MLCSWWWYRREQLGLTELAASGTWTTQQRRDETEKGTDSPCPWPTLLLYTAAGCYIRFEMKFGNEQNRVP
ncbi:unnamed protein product [Ectocarpus sp. 6 AP-2014]